MTVEGFRTDLRTDVQVVDPEDTDPGLAWPARHWGRTRPDVPCLTFRERTTTWGEFLDRSCRLAQTLRERGTGPGDRVFYLGRNRPEFFELLSACAMLGAVGGALNWRLAPRELAQLMGQAAPRVLLAEEGHVPDPGSGVIPVGTDVVEIAGAGSAYESMLAASPATDPGVVPAPDDVALLMYTSGTSGVPKGALFSHRALAASGPMARLTRTGPASVVLVAMPVFHASGATAGLMGLRLGAHTVVAQSGQARELLRLVARHRATMTNLVPAVLKAMVEEPAIAGADLSSLDTITYAGSPIGPDLIRKCLALFDCRLMQIYGMTETNGVTALPHEDHLDPDHPERLTSVGRPVEGATIRIVDPVSGEEVPDGEFGEVLVRARTSMSGYFGAPPERDPWIRTGDGGFLRDGYLYLRDRIKDMIISGGENIYSVEVENALSGHPGIAEVAVVGIPSERWGEAVKAVVVAGDASLTADGVVEFAGTRLARYKVPTEVEFVEELPRNASGKVLKHRLRRP